MRRSIFIAGLVIFVSAVIVFNIAITPSDKANIRLLSEITQTPLGQSILSLSSQLTTAGQQIALLSSLLALELPMYFLGGGLMFLGTYLKKRESRKLKHTSEIRKPETGV